MVYGGMNGQDGVTFNDMYELRPGVWVFESSPAHGSAVGFRNLVKMSRVLIS